MFPLQAPPRPRNPRRSLVTTPVSAWGNFNPLAIKPIFWVDASDTTSITSSGGLVSQWNDKSGNVRNFTQANASRQPTTGSATQNGLNVLTFGTSQMGTSSFAFAGGRFTCFAVARASTSAATNRQLLGDRATCPTMFIFNGNHSLYAGAVLSSATAYDTNWHVFTGVFNGTASALQLDGTQIASGNAGTGSYTGGALIGAGDAAANPFIGDIAEVISCPLLLTRNDIRTVENYLSAKWAIY